MLMLTHVIMNRRYFSYIFKKYVNEIELFERVGKLEKINY